MEKRVYKDYFTVPADYTANMTREAIDETPDKWLDFYPHAKYLDFLKTIFDELKSVWLTGNYGTGKSNAALVTQKLFMDDFNRVDRWFEEYRNVIPNCDALKDHLRQVREEGILVVYDYNASGVGPNEEFLVRLEKGLLAALKEHGYISPANANLDAVIERLKREGDNFFRTRDSMLGEMRSLKSDIYTVDQLVFRLREEGNSATPTHYLDDVQAVFHRDNIFLNVNVSTFRAWISAICKINNLKRIIYIFDEFSEFIDSNSGTLKTFEDVTEAPAVNHFYLVPVTHKELSAFYGENSPGAKKARDRFYFRNLQMPNDIAFRLAAHAMKPNEKEPYCSEWKKEKDSLWNSIVTVVDKFSDPETSEAYVARQSFYDILPIHPMAAFLLKFLAESARSNQRSIFEYLKGSADGREFQDFVATGGPQISNRQFLTVDYLWKYFMEREDSGQSRDIIALKMEYDRIKAREFANYDDEQPEIRVLKTVMLFTLLSRLNPNGHDRLRPTVENIELSFRGDGVVTDVGAYLRDLSENRHCFSIINGNIELYSSTVGNNDLEKKKQELSNQFYDLLADECKSQMELATRSVRAKFSGGRFDIRVSDVSHTSLVNITSTSRDKYSSALNNDDGSICLWFVVAKNKDEQLQIRERQKSLLQNLRGYRIIMIDFPEITFCGKNLNLWDEYIGLRAQYILENNEGARKQIKRSYTNIENEWTATLKAGGAAINLNYYDVEKNHIETRKSSWADIKTFLPEYMKKTMGACPDLITELITVYGNKGLKSWALAGIRFEAGKTQGQLVKSLKDQGVSGTDEWFSSNADHPFSQIRRLLEKKYNNTVGRNSEFSLRKAYIELQRAPFGMRYNCLSAFTLGFCLRWILDKNCQWTNVQRTQPLTEDDLAEIIEAAVSGNTNKEKLICRLSKEQKIFARRAGCMFGMPEREDSTPMDTLRAISSNIEETSCKVPLWVLADYIRTADPEDEILAVIFDDLCTALRVSSKGNKENLNSAITAVGDKLLRDPDIVDTAVKYTAPDVFITAFREYVDTYKPTLSSLANKVEDFSHAYCDLILNMAAPAAGWLWNKLDISVLMDQAECMYQIIDHMRGFLKVKGYISYDDVIARFRDKLSGAGFPYALVGEKYPSFTALLKELNGNQEPAIILRELQECEPILNTIYNDPQHKAVIDHIRELLGDIGVDDEGLSSIIDNMPGTDEYSAGMNVTSYIKLVRDKVALNVRNTLIRKNIEECKRICGYENVQNWTNETHLPSWTLFTEIDDGRELVRVLITPNDFTNDALNQKHTILEMLPKADITQCQAKFFEQIMPQKYWKLNIELASLLKFLTGKYGENANEWPENPDILDFIEDQYQEVFAPVIVSKLSDESAEDLKKRVLKMAKNDPDIGLKLMEQ